MNLSLDLLDKANQILEGVERHEVLEWNELKCTEVVSLVIRSNIEMLKDTWENSSDSAFDNAVQNAKGRAKCSAFRECLSIIDDVMKHLDNEEDEKHDEAIGSQGIT